MLVYRPSGLSTWRLLLSFLFVAAWDAGSGQVHYSVSEEAKHGTFVGRIAQDLGLELAELVPRLFRIASKGRGDFLEVNLQNGILFVNSRIDREELCGRRAECSIHLEVIVDRPLQVFHVEVEVKDINDNRPVFSTSEQKLSILESQPLDSRFPLEGASDADIGENAILTYGLSSNEFFTLDIINKKDKGKLPVLVLSKLLDREENPQLRLLLTATDEGKPELTGSVTLLILVLDANDNAPVFDQTVYEVKMYENSANQTLVIWLNASDADEGINKEVIYSFSSLVPSTIRRKFLINERTGEVRINDAIDFEDSNTYEIHVDVTDKGNLPMVGHCTILVEILDENDNSPVVVVTSLALPVREDAQVGTVISLISVSDRDSGANGQVTCSLTPRVPFKLVSTFKNYYSLVLDSSLDREKVSEYALALIAKDGGSPSLSTSASVSVEVADVNDNAPTFAQPEYTVFVKENNPPGCHIFTVSARDADAQENALVSYSLVERRVGERALSSYVSVHAESGKVYVNGTLDYEENKFYEIEVQATDKGNPPMAGHCTVWVEILDANDNAPEITVTSLSLPVREDTQPSTVISLISVSDRDSGANGQIICFLTPNVPFKIVSTFKNYYSLVLDGTLDRESVSVYKLVVTARDGGSPSLSATASVSVEVADVNDNAPAFAQPEYTVFVKENNSPGCHIFTVSALLVLTLLLYTALRCSAPPSEGACGPVKPRLVCSSAVGSWSYSQERRQRVCSGEGPPKTDLMAFSPSLPPGLDREVEERQEAGSNHSGLVSSIDPSPLLEPFVIIIYYVLKQSSQVYAARVTRQIRLLIFLNKVIQTC
uniref:Protocadherin alpha 11 n=1 Tax=Moschus moschiferus TaxID=68415 RepID=A0A8C6CN80_MOSMO